MTFVMLATTWLTGCAASLVPFTHEMRVQHELSDSDIQSLQFYVSNEVTLRREARTKGRIIDDGNLKLHAGKAIEEIVIEEHTPGVAVAIEAATIRISFSEGSALDFSLRTAAAQPLRQTEPSLGGFATPPDAFPGERRHDEEPVSLLDELGNYWLDSDDDTFVEFQGRQWETVEGTFRAHLMIDAESLEDVVENRTTLGGRRLSKNRMPFIRM
jgi:hypothetical protein